MKELLNRLKNPSRKIKMLVYIVTVLLIVGSICGLFLDYEGEWWSALIYALFGCSASFLGYAVFLFCKDVPNMKRGILSLLQKNRITEKMIKNYPFRTVLFSAFSLAFSILYSLYNGVLGLIFGSAWYGALCAYYGVLVCMRSGIVLYHGKHRKGERSIAAEVRKYRNVGWLLIVTMLALSVAILQMVRDGAGFTHVGLTIYVAAVYTFYKITMSIINLVKVRRFAVYTIQAVRAVNLADALVSVLALQTAMFQSFGGGGAGEAIANALTGGVVCSLVLALGIFMIISGNKRLKREKYGKEKV